MLTRNIVAIQASPDAADKTLFGGHVMAMVSEAKMYVSGAIEFNRHGARNMHLARYPHPLAPRRRWARSVRSRTPRFHDTYSRLRDRARHQRRARGKQRDLQHPSVTASSSKTPWSMATSSCTTLGILTKGHPDAPCVALTNLALFGSVAGGKNFDSAGQNAKDILIPSGQQRVSTFWMHQPGQHLRGQRGRGFRRHGFLVRHAGTSDGCIRRHGYQQGNLATSNADQGVQGQYRPF